MGLEEFNRDFGGKTGGGGVAQFNRDFGGDQPAINPRPEDYGPFQPLGPPSPSPTFGERVGQAYESVAGPVREWFQPAANNLVRAPYEIATGQRPFLTGLTAPPEFQTPPESKFGKFAAEVVNPVPPDLTSAMALLGTLGLAGAGPAARVIGAGTGAGLGSAMQGDPLSTQLWKGALSAGLTGTAELGSAAVSKVLRSLPGAQPRIAGVDAANYGQEMERQVPTLANARTAEDLRQLAAGGGREALSEMKEVGVTAIENLTGRGQIIDVQGTPMSLRAANDYLSMVGQRAFSKVPAERTFQGVDQRRLYDAVAEDIRQGIAGADPSGQASQIWGQIQSEYSKGVTFLRPLQRDAAFRMGEQGLQFNTPFFQRWVSRPLTESGLTNKLGDEGLEALRDVLLRGARPGTIDRLAPYSSMQDAAANVFRGGGNTYSLLTAPLPNLGSRYAAAGGQQPYTLWGGAQSFLDLLANSPRARREAEVMHGGR